MKRILLIALLLLSGCASEKPITINTIEKPQITYNPEKPTLVLSKPHFFVLTKDNITSIINTEQVIIGLTEDGYKMLAGNILETYSYIKKQNDIIDYYRGLTDK